MPLRHSGMLLSILVLFALNFINPQIANGQKQVPKNHQVIIIGAGVSGLSAAKYLRDQKVDVIVLEARNRIGGRVWSDRSIGNQALDLGASWIHSVEGNPIHSLAKKIKTPLAETDYDNAAVYQDSKRVPPSRQELQEKYYYEVLKYVMKADAQKSNHHDTKNIQQAADEVAKNAAFSKLSKREIDFLLNTNIEHEYAADVSQLSTGIINEGADGFGGDVIFPKGYDTITTYLSDKIDIRLNQVVTSIDYTGKKVEIKTHQGQTFSADQVIVTVPLGVLKKGKIRFQPELPPKKQKAIKALGMGTLNKLYLEFPSVFWKKDRKREFIQFIPRKKGRWAEWLNMAAYTGKPILLGFNAGTYAEEIEKRTDKEIVQDAMTVLKETYGNDIPEPTKWLITRWKKDPYSYGSYSYLKTGSRTAMRRHLAATVNKKLYFAGEATSTRSPSTVDGAYISGIREAKKILRNLKKQSKSK